MSEFVASDWNWVEVAGDSRSLPAHSDGVRVILSEGGWLTHGLASYPERPDPDVELLHGWKLWYFIPRSDLSRFRVVAWRELEELNE